uniref:Uncharacterized protein n=1 Tax=Oryza sativa subsp. japonica TaxID=39947 RepID=Q53KD7_ORYSJ|nr:hypothetical protein LOC_Os11g22420 [Oryza sativa Japonica Group]
MANKTLREFATPFADNVAIGPQVNIGDVYFDLKFSLITMAQASPFCGKPNEDANAHLQQFLEICSTYTIKGLSFNKMIETQLAQLASLVPANETGRIPGEPDSSIENVKAITTRGGTNGISKEALSNDSVDKEVQPEKTVPQEYCDTRLLPFPQRSRKPSVDEQFARFVEVIQKIHINVPLLDAIVMPKDVFDKLNFTVLAPTPMRLQLPSTPLILGRPFLSTARANIDVGTGSIRFHINGKEEKFEFQPRTKQCSMELLLEDTGKTTHTGKKLEQPAQKKLPSAPKPKKGSGSSSSHHDESSTRSSADVSMEDAEALRRLLNETDLDLVNDRERQAYYMLSDREYAHTREYSPELLKNIGMDVECRSIWKAVSWQRFAVVDEPGSRLLTLQFLCSLKEIEDGISFRFFRKKYTVTWKGLSTVTTGINPTGIPFVRVLFLVLGGKVHQKLIQFRV